MNRYSKMYPIKTIILQKQIARAMHNVKTALTIDDMPHPRSLPIFGTKIDLLAAGSGKKLHEYIHKRHQQLGSFFYEQLGGETKLVFTSDPAAMMTLFINLEGKYPTHLLPDPWVMYEKLYGNKRGLFFMNGEEWLVNRRAMNRHLLKENSEKWMINPVQLTVENFINDWKKKAESGIFNPNLESDFYRYSINVIISILLGEQSTLKLSKHSDMLLSMFSDSVKKIFQTTTKLYGLPLEFYQQYNLKAWREFKESVDTSLSLAQEIVTELLQKKKETQGLLKKLHEENLSDETIMRIVVDFVIAAGDTTAFTMLWIIYLLSKRTELVNEIRTRDKEQVKYVVKEAMRLYPVAPFLTRILPKESHINGYQLQKGTPIIASIYTSGRDEKNFSQAERFLPYRWDRKDLRRKNLENHVTSASLPFALGSRSCIGKKLAMLQITELIYQIVNNFDLECLNENEVKAITSQVLVPSEEIKISVSMKKSVIKEF